ncbi:MAG TPA: response regulator, partial [Azonexus sp.]|nr:response regulator [Azonexus sp.]
MSARDSVFVEKPTVMVVDDVSDNLSVMTLLLKDLYNVRVANSGERALKLAALGNPPDLILLDIMMPDMDGYEVCR